MHERCGAEEGVTLGVNSGRTLSHPKRQAQDIKKLKFKISKNEKKKEKAMRRKEKKEKN